MKSLRERLREVFEGLGDEPLERKGCRRCPAPVEPSQVIDVMDALDCPMFIFDHLGRLCRVGAGEVWN